MAEPVVVRVVQGGLRGRKVTTKSGATYFSFQGIPYAKPPVGPLRFKAPQPPDPWKDFRDSLVEGSVAPQIDDIVAKGRYEGEEDCLFLNVYTPQLPKARTEAVKPVMVWIHGGGFYTGSGNSSFYGPDHLMNGEIILVTINYRLGALGFLSTGDSVILGNNGLKDQVMALRWVQENIKQFGGDPGNVTIFGESAGGSSVHHLLLSPMSKGLFHRAIAQSGSALNQWAYDDASVARRKAFRFGEALGCKATDSNKLLEFLMEVPARELVEGMDKSVTEDEKHPLPLYFAPSKEISKNVEEVFLWDSPTNIISQGKFHKVPFMIGITSNEGMFCVKDIKESPSWYESLNEKFKVPLPNNFKVEENTAKYGELAGKIKDFYFGNKPISKDTWSKIADLYSDFWFVSGIVNTVRKQVAVSPLPIYFYEFAFEGKFGFSELWLGSKPLPGACHGDEIGYLFQMAGMEEIELDADDDSVKVLSRMVKMWTNFAKSGNPTPKDDPLLGITWTPATASEIDYLNIDKKLNMKTDLLKERVEFWEKIYESYEIYQ